METKGYLAGGPVGAGTLDTLILGEDPSTRWNGSAVVAIDSIAAAAWQTGLVTATEQLTSDGQPTGIFVFTVPPDLPAGENHALFYLPSASTVGSRPVGSQSLPWTGSEVATLGEIRLDTGNLISRLGAITGSGINTILGYFRALAASFSSGTPTDLSNGTTFNNATDSLQAIGTAVAEIDTGLTVLPVSATVSSGEVKSKNLTAYQFASLGPFMFTVCDDRGNPVNLSGESITFVAGSGSTRLWEITGCPVSGNSNNVVTVSQDSTNTQTSGQVDYVLRDVTANRVLARGELFIVAAPPA